MRTAHAPLLGPAMAGLLAVTGYAGRPLTVDDAAPVDLGTFEAEAGAGYHRDSACKHWDFPLGLTYGLLPGVEVGLGFGGQTERRDEWLEEGRRQHVHENGIGDLTLAGKARLLGEGDWRPRQALAATVKLPTADEDEGLGSGETDYDLTWIASKSLTDRLGIHVNAGHTWVGDPHGEDLGNVLHFGAAVDYRLADRLQWVGEIFTEDELGHGGGEAGLANTGIRWHLSDACILDVAAGTRVYGNDAPDLTTTAGLTWAFGLDAAHD